MLVMKRRRKSLRYVWNRLVEEEGSIINYSTFLRWVYRFLPELEKEGILTYAKGRKRSYVVLDEDRLIEKLREKGYKF